MASDNSFTVHRAGAATVVTCFGDVDILTAPGLQRRVDEALAQLPAALIIDLSPVKFFASHGMQILVETQRALGPAARFVVVADGPVTRRPMEIVGLGEVLDFAPTLTAALARLS